MAIYIPMLSSIHYNACYNIYPDTSGGRAERELGETMEIRIVRWVCLYEYLHLFLHAYKMV